MTREELVHIVLKDSRYNILYDSTYTKAKSSYNLTIEVDIRIMGFGEEEGVMIERDGRKLLEYGNILFFHTGGGYMSVSL